MKEEQKLDLLKKALDLPEPGSSHICFTEGELSTLARIARSVEFSPGQEVFREGDPGDALYVVGSGKVNVLKSSEGGPDEQLLMELEAPAILGEMALLDKAPRSATIRISQEGPATLLRISREDFEDLLGGATPIALKLTYRLAQSISQRLRASNVERLRLERDRLRQEVQELRQQVHQRYALEGIVGSSPAMRKVFDLMRKVMPSSITVLIQGETGTGKELVARALHYNGPRKDRPFMAVNCATLHKELLESELFGHEKGAFTGADHRHIGRLERANRGTLFLDEIGDMHPSIQAKVLRVLQERCFERLGGTEMIRVDVRLIAATNRDLLAPDSDIPFRKDLYYRIGVLTIQLPPLRERREDIPLLAEHFLERYRGPQSNIKGFHRDAVRALETHPWPGNVRELENVIQRALLVAEGPLIGTQDLLLEEPPVSSPDSRSVQDLDLERLEREAIREALRRSKGVQVEAARLLGVTRRVLHYKLQKHGLMAEFFQ
ncbi:MAG: sigma 54-interacting transcriptional regulator [Thermodesulfobacteriota bacterium]